MVNQKAISFKIDLGNLGGIDGVVRDSTYWTNRNRELNKAVKMYVEYKKAMAFYNQAGESDKMRKFCEDYIHPKAGQLF